MSEEIRLLLVDDDDMYRQYTIHALKSVFPNIQIREAGTIKEGLFLLSQEMFGCVLLDCMLPDGTGIDLLNQLKDMKGSVSCPIIMLTSLDNDEVGLAALQAGAEDYLVKGESTPYSLKRSIRYSIERFNRQLEFEEVTLKLKLANEQLESLVVTDSLTGIPNRRALQKRLAQLLSESHRGRKFAVILADIDLFKKFNDTYGHQMGDKILVQVAQTLSSTARETDFVARFGGEEFCILLTDVGEELAERQTERLRRAIHAISKYKITMSFGICVAMKNIDTVDALIRAADIALYHAKNSGRDRIVSFRNIKSRSDNPNVFVTHSTM